MTVMRRLTVRMMIVRGGHRRVARMSRVLSAHRSADITREGETDHYESECKR